MKGFTLFIFVLGTAIHVVAGEASRSEDISVNMSAVENYLSAWAESTDDNRATDRVNGLSSSVSAAVARYLTRKPWKGRVKPKPADPIEVLDPMRAWLMNNDLHVINIAVKSCDSRVMYSLLFALDFEGELDEFDYSHKVPNDDGLPFELNLDDIKKREPERFSPAAMGLLEYHNHVGVRVLMCEFIDRGDYIKLSAIERTIFNRIWAVIEDELKDGDKIILYNINVRNSPEFKNFKTQLGTKETR